MNFVITLISQAKRNPERVNVYLNGKFWLGLHKNKLITLKLVTDRVITELEKKEIETIVADSNLLDRVYTFMHIRPRSSSEVRDYLIYKRELSAEEADSIVTKLQENGQLSDEEFARWYIEYKLTTGINGLNKIKMELLQKKVDKTLVVEILDQLSASDDFKEDQLTKIEEYAQKIIKTLKAKDLYDLKSKLIQRLMARGFKYDEIKKVLALPTFHLYKKDV
jgi:regulatory protein